MARIKVNPTRMELKNLERRYTIAHRGHRLLKEKQDSLTQQLLALGEAARSQRRLVEREFRNLQVLYRKASLYQDESLIEKHLMKRDYDVEVDVMRDYVGGIRVPGYALEVIREEETDKSVFAMSQELEKIESMHVTLLPKLVELSKVEKRFLIVAKEVKETRRRVNALEHRTIPNLKETIVFIKMKIDENDRSQKARVMKVK